MMERLWTGSHDKRAGIAGLPIPTGTGYYTSRRLLLRMIQANNKAFRHIFGTDMFPNEVWQNNKPGRYIGFDDQSACAHGWYEAK